MDFYFSSVLLERHRWTAEKKPTYRVTDWLERFLSDGFSGLELWENHAYAASAEEMREIRDGLPTILFNTYADFSNDSVNLLIKAAEAIGILGAVGCKFNFGNDPERLAEYISNFRSWRRDLPRDFRYLCECHDGTLLETPRSASGILDRLGTPDVDVIVHADDSPEMLGSWFNVPGNRVTHCHLNLFRSVGDPWEDNAYAGYHIRDSLDIISRSSVRTTSVEFVHGVGRDYENMDELYSRAIRDRNRFASLLDGC